MLHSLDLAADDARACSQHLDRTLGTCMVSCALVGDDRFACLVTPNRHRTTEAAVVLVDFASPLHSHEDPFFITDGFVTEEDAVAAFAREILAAR